MTLGGATGGEVGSPTRSAGSRGERKTRRMGQGKDWPCYGRRLGPRVLQFWERNFSPVSMTEAMSHPAGIRIGSVTPAATYFSS